MYQNILKLLWNSYNETHSQDITISYTDAQERQELLYCGSYLRSQFDCKYIPVLNGISFYLTSSALEFLEREFSRNI